MITAIIPARSPLEAKSRLAPRLDASERARLARALLAKTLTVVSTVQLIERIIVVCPLDAFGVLPNAVRWLEDPGGGLNAAVQTALSEVAGAALVLPTDLPLINVAAVCRVIDEIASVEGPVAVAVPDRAGDGTNALLVRPANRFQPHYGPGSFQAHRSEAIAAGFAFRSVEHPDLALDLDWPTDYDDVHANLEALGFLGPLSCVAEERSPDEVVSSWRIP